MKLMRTGKSAKECRGPLGPGLRFLRLLFKRVNKFSFRYFLCYCLHISQAYLVGKMKLTALFTQVGPRGTHANPWKISGPFKAHTNAQAWIAKYRLIKMHASPDSFDKQSKKWRKIASTRTAKHRKLALLCGFR